MIFIPGGLAPLSRAMCWDNVGGGSAPDYPSLLTTQVTPSVLAWLAPVVAANDHFLDNNN